MTRGGQIPENVERGGEGVVEKSMVGTILLPRLPSSLFFLLWSLLHHRYSSPVGAPVSRIFALCWSKSGTRSSLGILESPTRYLCFARCRKSKETCFFLFVSQKRGEGTTAVVSVTCDDHALQRNGVLFEKTIPCVPCFFGFRPAQNCHCYVPSSARGKHW